jgi:outer membrane protein, heavy metal efflux system
MKRLAVFAAMVLAALPSGAAIAAETPFRSPIELTADAAVREALEANRDLQAAIETVAIARGRLLQAGRLANPELEASYGDDFAFAAEGERTASVGLAQRFPVTSRLGREKDVADKDVAVAAAEVRDAVRTLVAEVESAFYAVRALDERIAVNAELIASVRQVEHTTVRRLRAAEASPAEVGLLRIERLRLEQEAQRLAREREVTAAALTRLLGRGSSDEIAPVGELDPGPAPPATASRGGPAPAGERPDLEAARHGVERADADLALARAEVWEDWTVGLGYQLDRQVFDGAIPAQRDSLLTLGVRVPIPLWNRQQGRIAAAEAELRRSRRLREARVLRVAEETRAAEARIRTLRSSVDAYSEEILPEAIRSRDLFERGYRQGLVGIAELLQAQRQYTEVRALYLELLGDLRQAAIDLEAARGTSPFLDGLEIPGGNAP